MQVTFGRKHKQPVWITQGIEPPSIAELLEDLGYEPNPSASDITECDWIEIAETFKNYRDGWWFAACHPGCLPDSDFIGPYKTERLAFIAARKFFNRE